MKKFIIHCFEPDALVYFIADNRICASKIYHARIHICKGEENIYYYIDNYDGEKHYKESFFVFPTIAALLDNLSIDFNTGIYK